jgi:serine/threonine protein kinase/tetratricopeptide (TPR) repeat protein
MPIHGEKKIFEAARQLADRAARRSYLQQACGDDQALLARVEALLRVHDEQRAFLESPAVPPPTFPDGAGEGPGTQLGPYKLVERIGEGGFGVVFEAVQQQPIRRTVALKILKPGMDSRQVLARFQAEQQALALMDHPNIARVMDAGNTALGRSYFVMELVKGSPITTYCDLHHLTTRERLELFVPVCQAVQHAHQKGIIHRDLKPSNVLVTLSDGRPVPKVIDFGVAKAIGPQLTEQTLQTELGTMVGTVEYMSPEQAGFNQLDVDTRSDIYSLGVLLYELLAGSPPFSRKELEHAGLLEVLRVIREQEPPRPSTKLSTADGLPTLAANRGTEPQRLTALVRGELDWIVMKALEKDRSSRYATANGFAQDLQRYLAEEPVEACPPSASYRLRKFARRNRKWLLVAGAFVLLLATGVVGVTWQAIRATLAEQATGRERDRAVAERERADNEAASARAVNEFLLQDLLGQADIGNQPAVGARNRNITVRELLDQAAVRIDKSFKGQELTEATVRLTLGRAYQALGEFAEAAKHLNRSQALREQSLGADHPLTLESLHEVALLHRLQGRHVDAEVEAKRVLEARRAKLGDGHPDTLLSLGNLASFYRDLGRFDEAEPLFRQALDGWNKLPGIDPRFTAGPMHNLAELYMEKGRYDEAEPLLKEALGGFRAKLGYDHPDTLQCMNTLATLHHWRKHYDEAELLLKQVLEARRLKLGDDHLETIRILNSLGGVYWDRGQYREAEPLFKRVLDARRAKLGADHPDTLRTMNNLALVYGKLGKPDEESMLKQVMDGWRAKLGADHPDTLLSMNNLATHFTSRGRYDEALPLAIGAVAGAKKRFGLGHPLTQTYVNNLTSVYSKQGKPQLAEPWLREAVEFLRENGGAEAPAYARQLIVLADNLLQQKKHAEAESFARASLAIRSSKEPDLWTTFNTESLLGETLLGQKKHDEAEHSLLHGYEGMLERQAKIPPDVKFRLTLALERLVLLYDAWGKPEKAAPWRKRLEAEQVHSKK